MKREASDCLNEALAAIFEDAEQSGAFAKSLVDQAMKGNATLAKEILARVAGPVRDLELGEVLSEEETLDRIEQLLEMVAERREAEVGPRGPGIRFLFGEPP